MSFGVCVLALWGFWMRGGGVDTGHYSRSCSEPRKGKGLGQASRMVGLPGSEIPDPPRAVASYSASSRPRQNNCAFPRGRPPALVLLRGSWGSSAQVRIHRARSLLSGYQAQPPSCCPPCLLWVYLLPLLASVLLTSPTSAALDRGPAPPPRSRWQTASEHTEHGMDSAAPEILGRG